MKKILTVLALLFSSTSFAGTIDCGFVDVGVLYVQGERSDGSGHANKLLVALGGVCPSYGYVSNTDPAYDSTLSMLLAAKMSNSQLRILVNDGPLLSGAARIELVNFK